MIDELELQSRQLRDEIEGIESGEVSGVRLKALVKVGKGL